jgi:hypothetical protein
MRKPLPTQLGEATNQSLIVADLGPLANRSADLRLRARPEMILRFLRLDCYQVSFSACFHGHLQSRRLHGESYLQL